MKALTIVSVVVFVLCVGVSKTLAEPNQQINYQGKLTDSSGVAVPDGTYNVRFWLLQSTSQATTSAVWTESLTGANKVQITNGLFSVMLGSTSPLTSVDFNQTLYLGVEIGGTGGSPSWDGEMSPRKPLGTVPAAFESLKLGGVASSSFVRSDEADVIAATTAGTLLTITQSGTGDILNLFDGATEVFTVTDGGKVGIGTTSPYAKLSVAGAAHIGGNLTATGTVTFTGLTGGLLTTNANGVLSTTSTSTLFSASDNWAGTFDGQEGSYYLANSFSTSSADYWEAQQNRWATTSSDYWITTKSIESLSDVAAMTENYGDLFYWNGTAWADIATSSLGLGNGTFLGLSDTPSSFTSNAIPYVSGSALAFNSTFVYDGTNLGLGTASPGAMLDIFGTSNSFRLSYDGSNYSELSVDSSGVLSISSTGGTGSGYSVGSGLAEDVFALFDGNALDYYLGLDDSDDTFKLGTGGTVGAGVIASFTSATTTFNNALFATSTSADTALTVKQSGTGDILNLFDGATEVFTVTDGGKVGIGTTSPAAKLSVKGNTWLDSNVISFASSTASNLLLRYYTSATSTIKQSSSFAWTIATSSLASPIFRIDTSGSYPNTLVTGGFDVNNGALSYDASTNQTTIQNLALGNMRFADDAGVVTWTDMGVTSGASAGTVESYTAAIDGNSLLTLYGKSDGAGGVTNLAVGIGTTSPWARFSVLGDATDATKPLFTIATSTGTTLFHVTNAGKVGIGTTSPSAKLSIGNTGVSGAGILGLDQYLSTANSVLSAVQYGNRYYLDATSNTATTTIVGSMLRLKDSTTYGNTVRAFEVQANRGVNTLGENTAISAFARTFGVRAVTSGDAGDTYEPAAGFFETEGTTQGNALRAYTDTLTTASLLSLFHTSSTFAGTGIEMNFGNGAGSFSSTTSKYLDFQNAGTSVFTVTAYGTTTIGDGTTNHLAGLQIGYGGICVDNDGSCTASTSGRITAVESLTGNSDLAEMYFSSTNLEPGEVVVLDEGLSIDRAEKGSETPILGVVSTKPGLLLGFDDSSLRAGEQGYPVALSGRVPVKLSTENGPIKRGDTLMLSSIPGVAMKATSTGATIGIALEDFDDTRKYSETYLNQFADDMVEPNNEPIFTNLDPRINDGCYYGGGNAVGDAPCIPLAATTTEGQIAEANEIAEAESIADQIDALRDERSETKRIEGGESVKVGQIVMFVDRGYRLFSDNQLASLGALMGTSSITTVGNQEDETIFDRIVALANRFVDGVLSVFTLKADRVETSELCVDGVCVDATDLRQLLDAANSSHSVIDEFGQDFSQEASPVFTPSEESFPPTSSESTNSTTTESTESTASEDDAGVTSETEAVESVVDDGGDVMEEAVTEEQLQLETSDQDPIPVQENIANSETPAAE